MGNSGAYFLGFMLGVISVMGALKLPTVLALVIPVFAMGIPFLDTLWAVWRRWRNGEQITRGDRYHIHHLLLTSGLGMKKIRPHPLRSKSSRASLDLSFLRPRSA